MNLLNDELREQLSKVFDNLPNPVSIALFTDANNCYTCNETLDFMKELDAIADKITFQYYNIDEDVEMASKYDIKMVPSLVLLDHKGEYHGIKFNGIPAGHEINSFITGIMEISGAGEALPDDIAKRLSKIHEPINIKVFVTLGCPYCPGAVSKAHKLALENDYITAEMIEAETFHDMAHQFNVSSVPKIVINDTVEFTGNQPIEIFLDELEHAQEKPH